MLSLEPIQPSMHNFFYQAKRSHKNTLNHMQSKYLCIGVFSTMKVGKHGRIVVGVTFYPAQLLWCQLLKSWHNSPTLRRIQKANVNGDLKTKKVTEITKYIGKLQCWEKPVAMAISSNSTPPTHRTAGKSLCISKWFASSSKPHWQITKVAPTSCNPVRLVNYMRIFIFQNKNWYLQAYE